MNSETGFMPQEPPLGLLPDEWNTWEDILKAAQANKIQLGDKLELSEAERAVSESWRKSVGQMPLVATDKLLGREDLLRRAHHVLSFVLHFYVHSLPPTGAVTIPSSLALPLLRISKTLDVPPMLTYSDGVYYNWGLRDGTRKANIDNLRCLSLFTGTADEEEFHLTSARMELRGAEALQLLLSANETVLTGEDDAIITSLLQIPPIFQQLKTILLSIRDKCDPDLFYRDIRPWLGGYNPSVHKNPWIFEGIEDDPSLNYPVDLGGITAAQSCMFRAFDLLIGIDGGDTKSQMSSPKSEFIEKMLRYMHQPHRDFLLLLYAKPPPLRAFVEAKKQANPALGEAYNAVVHALKELRDAHIIIVTTYVIQPARRLANSLPESEVKGTGGSNVMNLLKGIRDGTVLAKLE